MVYEFTKHLLWNKVGLVSQSLLVLALHGLGYTQEQVKEKINVSIRALTTGTMTQILPDFLTIGNVQMIQ